ncbi:MAG: HDOD domain-containing protein [Thermodesulfobacteriota bacterium]
MTEKKGQPSGKLAEIFAKMNMSELPAMSAHVQELISLVHSSRSAAYDLSRVILKDYSLTNKVLQVVNSAYYSIGQSVSSISKAVTILGFDAVRDLATAIALFEDFVKSGVDKEGISKLMTRSFLSALQCRDIAGEKKINVPPEEAFVCGLLHNLGKIIAFIYLPAIYQEIEKKMAAGIPEDTACRHLLEDLTFAELGQEIARFWNLSDKVVGAMETDPAPPKTLYDTEAYLRNLCDFSNRFVDKICNGEDTTELLGKYGAIISINHEKALEILTNCVETSQDISDSVRYGLSKLKIHSKLEKAARQPLVPPEEGVRPAAPKRSEEDELDELPSSDKSINEFIKEMADTLMGPFQLNEFYAHLLEAIYRGIGFDRVILCVINMQATKISLVGRFGLGDIDAADIANFEQPLANIDQAIPKAMKLCKDVAIEPDTIGAFPEKLHYLVKGRTVYLLPIVVNNKAIALLYMDRKSGRPKLGKNRIKALRLFRDFAAMAIKKSSRKG